MPPVKDMVGMRFGRLLVYSRAEDHVSSSGKHYVRWNCLCDCGNTKVAMGTNLRRRDTTSCGCLHKEKTAEASAYDLAGKRFGMLTVICLSTKRSGKYGRRSWECVCDCGKFVVKSTSSLTAKRTESCGCILKTKNLRYKYELAYGKLPDGLVVTTLDGDITNTNIENLVAVRHDDYMRYHRSGLSTNGHPDLKRAHLELIALERVIRDAEKRQ